MKQQELMSHLMDLGIITCIGGDEWFITEKYKDLLKLDPVKSARVTEVPKEKVIDKLLDSTTCGKDWGVEILETKGRSRAAALMDACNIPMNATPRDKAPYRLRGLDKDAINIVGNIVDNKDIDPETFIKSIRFYYKNTEMPKSFKNLLVGGEVFDVYTEFISGDLQKSVDPQSGNKENNQWH